MNRRFFIAAILLLSLILPIKAQAASYQLYLPVVTSPDSSLNTPRINIPYLSQVSYPQTALLWFGQVKMDTSYTDVRMAYTPSELYVNFSVFDRRIWYDTNPTPGSLTQWDGATLLLDKSGSGSDTLSPSAYRFDNQFSWSEDRNAYQAAYQGSAGGWQRALISYNSEAGWRGDAPNNDGDDRGWVITFHIPYSSLGLSEAPAQNTVWKMGLVLHNRNSAEASALPDQFWPEAANTFRPSTWGALHYGMPTFQPPSLPPSGSTLIRQGQNGINVKDGEVGGGAICGEGLDIWTQWGDRSQPGSPDNTDFNIQNQSDLADFPCFSRAYITFPIDSIPAGKVILSASLHLFQFGGSGGGEYGTPPASYIQIFTVNDDWDEQTLSWNNGPKAQENVSAAWVDPLPSQPAWPGVQRNWDISRAVAQAYTAGKSLRIAIYSADDAYHTGKYFVSSHTGDWNTAGRPAVEVIWTNP